jgi:hypothetical protein
MIRKNPNQPIVFNTARRKVTTVNGPLQFGQSPYDNYDSMLDVHPIQDVLKAKEGILLQKWDKVTKKENDTARKEVTPTEAKEPEGPQGT